MNPALRLVITSFLGLAFPCSVLGSFIVPQWSLGSGVTDFHSGQSESHSFNEVMSPFVNNHSVAVPPSTAMASYNFAFDDFSASFHTTAAHQALDVPPSGLFSASGGNITIQTTQDLLVSVSGYYTVALPPDQFFSRLEASITHQNPYQFIWGESQLAHSFGGNPVNTTLHVDTPIGGVLLPGGSTYSLSYTFYLTTDGGGTNAIGTGNGEIQWNIQVVPENATITLLFPALALTAYRRRRR